MRINAYKIVKLILILISAWVSVNAFFGGYHLLTDPTGSSIKLDKYLTMLPFGNDYFIYGIMLICFNGIGQLICLLLLLFNFNKGGVFAGISASILLIWVTVQLLSIGWFTLSTLYFFIGIIQMVLSLLFCTILKKYYN